MRTPNRRRLALGAVSLALIALVGLGAMLSRTQAAQGDMVYGPMFEVDPLWPQPLPNHWLLGTTIGVSVDNRDHIWIIHRGDSLSAGEVPAAQDPPNAVECCFPAPPVLELIRQVRWSVPGAGQARATSGQPQTTGSSLTIWTTCGSVEMVVPIPIC